MDSRSNGIDEKTKHKEMLGDVIMNPQLLLFGKNKVCQRMARIMDSLIMDSIGYGRFHYTSLNKI